MARKRAARPALVTGIAILKALARRNEAMSVADLCVAVGAPRSTAYRVLGALAEFGLVTRVERGRFALGPEAVTLALARDEVLAARDGARLSRHTSSVRRGAETPLVLREPDATRLFTAPPRARRGKLRLGFSNASLDNPWRTALVHSVEFAVSRFRSEIADMWIGCADNSAERQAEQIRAFAGDGLVVSATHGNPIAEALADAERRGIPVVLVDRGVPADFAYASSVGTDNFGIGHVTALWLAEHLDGRGRVALLAGRRDAEPARLRLEGAVKAFAAFPEIETLPPHWTGWQRDAGFREMRRLLEAGGRIDGVWACSGLQGVGSIEAFLAAGYSSGTIPPHTGGDLNYAYKLALRYGIPLASRDYPPAMGFKAVEILLTCLQGRSVPRRVEVTADIVATRGHATASVRPDLLVEDHVRWDLPDELILATGLGAGYDPMQFRVNYPGNRYNRSAVRRLSPHAA